MTQEDKDFYEKQMVIFISEAINIEVQKYDYDDSLEVALWTRIPSKFMEEALTINKWYTKIWEDFYTYFDAMTEETTIGTDKFMEFIPELII